MMNNAITEVLLDTSEKLAIIKDEMKEKHGKDSIEYKYAEDVWMAIFAMTGRTLCGNVSNMVFDVMKKQ